VARPLTRDVVRFGQDGRAAIMADKTESAMTYVQVSADDQEIGRTKPATKTVHGAHITARPARCGTAWTALTPRVRRRCNALRRPRATTSGTKSSTSSW